MIFFFSYSITFFCFYFQTGQKKTWNGFGEKLYTFSLSERKMGGRLQTCGNDNFIFCE